MLHPLSRHWDQPERSKLFFLNEEVVGMTDETWQELSEYSCSTPSGVYAGKMWKSIDRDGWWLCWYSDSPRNENMCEVKYCRALVLERVLGWWIYKLLGGA